LPRSRLSYWITKGISSKLVLYSRRLSSRLRKLSTFSRNRSHCESATKTIPSAPRSTSLRVML